MDRLNESRIGAVVAEAFAVRASTSSVSTLHAQHGAGLFVALESEVTVAAPGSAPVSGRVVLVPPDRPHAARCDGPLLGFVFDPELLPGVAGPACAPGEVRVIPAGLATRMNDAARAHGASLSRPDVLAGLARELAAWLANDARERAGRPRALDRRVARVIEALRDPEVDAREAVARAGVSEAHLQKLFARDVGLPMRTYRLWRRLLVGVAALGRMDTTTAAHAAGFADLAHLSRTCRRMLGYTPTALRQGLLGE